MSEDAAIRRANLKQLCATRNWSPSDLHSHLWGTYAYWHNMLAYPSKSFGEKVARRIEEELGLGRGWLDEDRAPQSMRYPRATECTPSAEPPPPRLPFSLDLVTALHRCGPAKLVQLENTLRAQLDMPPISAKTPRP